MVTLWTASCLGTHPYVNPLETNSNHPFKLARCSRMDAPRILHHPFSTIGTKVEYQ